MFKAKASLLTAYVVCVIALLSSSVQLAEVPKSLLPRAGTMQQCSYGLESSCYVTEDRLFKCGQCYTGPSRSSAPLSKMNWNDCYRIPTPNLGAQSHVKVTQTNFFHTKDANTLVVGGHDASTTLDSTYECPKAANPQRPCEHMYLRFIMKPRCTG
ncbi:hypothetical protein PGT21_007725 [Puccinia graminis f. sp. tritici]|uniref:Secreted protein n=1 Tax=Puccinia graminis f. sp. tritici TaxID=56615 RepID=A0A5B0RE98_PUCGR|nr:hypothetical protein PGT21_007725 [Puccinia graminis f. sp. tritici]KAA1123245.1 hypothetical protein PGTUg99_015185 [Puccinia graminis f. sp. tritici]